MPQPMPTINEVREFVFKLLNKEGSISEFEFAQFNAKINELHKVHPALATCFRGTYFAMHGDVENTITMHEKAIKLRPQDSTLYANYASSLVYLEQYSQGIKLFRRAIQMEPDNAMYLNQLLLIAYNSADTDTLEEFLPKYKQLTGKQHPIVEWLEGDDEDEEFLENLPEIVESAQKEGFIPREEVKETLGL